MGAIDGTLTYKLFFTEGDRPPRWKERFVKHVERNSFEELTPQDEEEESLGWVKVDRPLQTDIGLHDMLWNNYLNLSLRHDRYVIPSALADAHFEEARREYLLDNDKDELSKFEKQDIEEMVNRRLKEKQLPRMRIIDMCWDMNSGRVRFWSQSNKMCERFQQIFRDTFEMKLLPGSPYINGVRLGLDPEEVEVLQQVQPTNFIGRTIEDS